MKNRSVPADVILPHISYRNLEAAIQWLNDAFGFVEHYRYGDPISGAQLHLGNAWIMVKAAKEGTKNPAQLGYGTQSLTDRKSTRLNSSHMSISYAVFCLKKKKKKNKKKK